MLIGAKVRIIDHEDFEEVQRVGAVGTVAKIEERTEEGEGQKYVYVMFAEGQPAVEYPFEVVQELTEAEQQQLGKGGKDGMPDTSKPTPPEMDTDQIDDLSGEQDQVAQADSKESRPKPGSAQDAGVESETLTINGETPQLKGYPAGTGGTSSKERPETGSAQSAGVKGEQLKINGEQPQLKNVDKREKVSGVKDSTKAKPGRQVEGIFQPIKIRVLDEAGEPDSYSEVGSGSAVRSERHLMGSVREAIRRAMESMDAPFDAIDIVFRRDPKVESVRRVAERRLIGELHLVAEGKSQDVTNVTKAASRAARLGIKPSSFAAYAIDEQTREVLKKADRLAEGFWAPGVTTPVWPPKKLESMIGQEVIVETVTNDVWKGTLQRASTKEGQTGTKRMYEIKMSTGRKVFSPHDIRRILGRKKVG